jgi:hypothetical protein
VRGDRTRGARFGPSARALNASEQQHGRDDDLGPGPPHGIVPFIDRLPESIKSPNVATAYLARAFRRNMLGP